MIVDTHGHVQFNAFQDDGNEVIRRAFEADVAIIMPSSQIDTSSRAVQFAERVGDIRLWAAVGLHPIHLEDIKIDEDEVGELPKFKTRQEEFKRENYEPFLESAKVIAVGEIGLDYWKRPRGATKKEEYKKRQRDTLVAQLDMAADHGLPVILHNRVAHEDMLDILASHRITKEVNLPGVIHSFTGDGNQLKAYLALGYYIGFNGIIFKLQWLDDVIKTAPLDRILLETDSPYLLPPTIPQSELLVEGRNEPIGVKYVAERIAELKGISVEQVEEQTTRNAQQVFKIEFA